MTSSAWKHALHQAAPWALVGLMSSSGRPVEVDGMPWDHAIALRISSLQWSPEAWSDEHYAPWIQAWHEELPRLDFSTKEGQRPLVFSLLEDLGVAEGRYRSGRMHLSGWMSFVAAMTTRGLDLDARTNNGTSALFFLLTLATQVPYAEISQAWIANHGATFSALQADQVVSLFDRLIPSTEPGQWGQISSPVQQTLLRAIDDCTQDMLSEKLDQWCGGQAWGDLAGLIAAAQAREIKMATPSLDQHAQPGRRL